MQMLYQFFHMNRVRGSVSGPVNSESFGDIVGRNITHLDALLVQQSQAQFREID